MKQFRTDVFTLMVDSEFGVLTRITALIRRAGGNIRSLSVAQTAVPEISRLTVSLDCRHFTLDSVLDRLRRLNCVREISVFSPDTQVAQELCLLRVAADSPDLDALCARWDAQKLDQQNGEVILSVRCAPDDTPAMQEQFQALGLLDMARTGTIALDCGKGAADHA